MAKRVSYRAEGRAFLSGMGIFFAVFVVSYAFVMFITPIPYTAAGFYALMVFLAGVVASIALIFTRHAMLGLGGSLATILYVVLFAVTWPLVH